MMSCLIREYWQGSAVHLDFNELGFKEHLAFNEVKSPGFFFPSLTLVKYLASNKLISDPS